MTFQLLYFLLFLPSIATCPLKTVDIRSGCYCGIEIDGTNYIHCHPYSMNQIPQFTRSYIHEKLNFSQNFIENLTNQSFLQLKVKRIYLEENPIRLIEKQSFNSHLLHYLEELYIDTISNHHLEFLCYGSWTKLRILKLSGFYFNNQFQVCLEKLHRLEKLIIQNSQLNLISHHISKLPFLFELSLIHNQMDSLNFDTEWLTYSSSIRILNLTYNHLQTIPKNLNLHLPHLLTLDLSHNQIEHVPIMNPMTTLNINLSFNAIHYFHFQDNQHSLDLSSNPLCTMERTTEIFNSLFHNLTNLHCDCRLAWFSNSLDRKKFFGEETICATPEPFHGLFLKDLSSEQLRSICSVDLPKNCREVTNFVEIHQQSLIENTTRIIETTERLNPISSFHLTSFYTIYENNDLLIFWDFQSSSSSFSDLLPIQFQILIEQESFSKIEIIRRTDFISPYLKQYIIPHLPSNQNYYVCLLLTRSSLGTEKYCRETKTFANPTFLQMLFLHRSIVFGFLVGTILTTSLLITLAFICHLHYKRKHSHPLFDPHQTRNRSMYITRNELDGTYSHSIISSPSKYHHHHRRRTYLSPVPPWFNRNLNQLSTNPRTPCCFLQYHDQTLSESITTNRITSLSSEYSNGLDKEQMTSTSLMSNTSLDEQQPNQPIQSPTRHVYEELGDTNFFL